MNRTDFLRMMEDSSSIDSATTSDIGEIVAMFPYFQTAHLLLLKGLYRNSDIRFTNQLRNSAIHIADREILYQFLYSTPDEEPIAEEQHPDVKSAVEPEKETSLPDASVLPQETGQNVSIQESSQVIEETNDGTDQIAGPETDPVIESNQILAEDPDQLLAEENSELPAEENRGLTAEENRPVPVEESNPVIAEETIQVIAEESSHVDDVTEALAEGPVDEAVLINEVPVYVSEQNDPLLELDTEKGEVSDNPVENVTPEPAKLSQSDLIDRFIIANPRIEPNREKKEVPVEDRSAPVYEEGGFVTETLARIYISQGYYSKAIDIFEKLSLKYPEKSSYFATQIEKVKEYLKK